MVKHRLNGKLKWIIGGTIAGLVGTGFMVGEKILYLASVPATVQANVEKDEKEHAIFDAATRKTENVFVGVQKDIAEIQKDVKELTETQKSIDEKLEDLILIQLGGPGSAPTR